MKKILLAIVAVISITLLVGCGSKKTLHCSSEQNTGGVISSNSIDVSFNGNTAEKIDVSMSITVPESVASYMDTFVSQLEGQRPTLEAEGYKVDVTTKGNVITLKATGTDKTLTDSEKTGSYEATKKYYESKGLTCK